MEAWLKVFVGLGFLIASLGYLYRPQWVLKWNVWGRATLFNDSHLLLYRRRAGLVLFLAAVLFFYSGFLNLARRVAADRPSSYLELTDAYRSFREQHYRGAIVRCQEILKHDSRNVHAWTLMAESWAALGRKDEALRAWDRVLALDPDNPVANSAFTRNPPRRKP